MPSSSANIRRRFATLQRRAAALQAAVDLLRIECPHRAPHYKYRGNTGSHDPSDDSYWIDWSCPDCGKRWTTGQSHAEVLKYPGAVEVRK